MNITPKDFLFYSFFVAQSMYVTGITIQNGVEAFLFHTAHNN